MMTITTTVMTRMILCIVEMFSDCTKVKIMISWTTLEDVFHFHLNLEKILHFHFCVVDMIAPCMENLLLQHLSKICMLFYMGSVWNKSSCGSTLIWVHTLIIFIKMIFVWLNWAIPTTQYNHNCSNFILGCWYRDVKRIHQYTTNGLVFLLPYDNKK